MDKIRISESQFRQMVREEGEKIKKEILLRAQIEKIDQELAQLSEVHAGGNMEPGKDGVHAGQKKPVFTKKGTHLVEDETEEMDATEMGGEEAPMDDTAPMDDAAPMDAAVEMPTSEESVETLTKDDIMSALQDLGNKLDLQGTIEFVGNEEGVEGEMEGGDDSIELDVDIEDGAEDAVGGEEMGAEEMGGEETSMDSTEAGAEEEMDECEDGALMEEKKEETGIVAENTDPKKQKLNEERERMKFLAGIK